jgi:hypothetical protein
MRVTPPWKRGVKFSALATALVVAGGLVVGQNPAASAVDLVTSSVRGSDGRTYTVTNHLVPGATAMRSQAKEWLLVWGR